MIFNHLGALLNIEEKEDQIIQKNLHLEYEKVIHNLEQAEKEVTKLKEMKRKLETQLKVIEKEPQKSIALAGKNP